ncbi:hypothetical protein YM18_1636 [Geobacter sulfurreducens]|nr:hypothetical protein YM18_1636 [Geobacter sulfurreducens]
MRTNNGFPRGKRIRAVLSVVVVAVALLLGCAAGADEGIKEGGKKVGEGFKTIGKETGQAFKEGGKEIGQGVKQMGKEAGQEAKKTGRSVGEWFRETGRKTGEAFREMGRSIKRFFTGEQVCFCPSMKLDSLDHLTPFFQGFPQ